MITVNVRKQGGAAIMTIPSEVLRMLHIEIGSTLELDVTDGAFIASVAHKKPRVRYTLLELLKGVTAENITALNSDTVWADQGIPVGRELI